MKKSQKSFSKLRAKGNKNGRQVFDDLSADICVYLDLQEFISFLKGKIAVLYLCFWTPQFSRIDSKNPDKIGVFAEHIFLCSFYGPPGGIRTPSFRIGICL